MTKTPVSGFSYIGYTILSVYRTIAQFQVIFFIDLSNVILSRINQELKILHIEFNVIPVKSNVNNFVLALRQIKIIHFKMFKVATLINSRFGWFLILLVIHLIVIPCTSLFNIFVFFTGPSDWKARAYRNYFKAIY